MMAPKRVALPIHVAGRGPGPSPVYGTPQPGPGRARIVVPEAAA
jgi:hypothetical protein